MKRIFSVVLIFLGLAAITSTQSIKSNQKTYLFEIDGIINPIYAEYINDGFKKVEEGASIIIRMNTPGGLMESMNSIIKDILNAPNPVIVWIGPQGSQAFSAGVFITMASDIACMAPSTSLGAAHPVQMGIGGQSPSQNEKDSKTGKVTNAAKTVMEDKITKGSAAYMRSLAQDKNRNWQWAEKAVTESLSLTEKEALEKNVIEYIFTNIAELTEKLDGKKITKNGKEYTFHLKDSLLITMALDNFKKFLNVIAHPNIAYILLMLGIYGLIYEFASPGIGVGIVLGSLFLILAFFSLQVLPVNIAGLLLLVTGMIIMVLDFVTPSFGLLLTGGLVSFIMGSLMLFDDPTSYIKVSLDILITMTLASVGFFALIVGNVIKSRRKKVTTGAEAMIGSLGVSRSKFGRDNTHGTVFVHGELWSAVLDHENQNIKEGDEIVVTKVEGNKVIIKLK
ncbi:nodulation protein NfeD [bacterium]